MKNKEIIYIDMDDTICDFKGYSDYRKRINPDIKYPQCEMDFFRKLKPFENINNVINYLIKLGYDVWILTKPSVLNPLCYTEKRLWVEDHLGIELCHKLILCPDKSLLRGDILIDDNKWDDFEGQQLLYGSEEFPNWKSILKYFKNINKLENGK